MRQGQNPKRSRGRNSGRRNASPRHQTIDSNGPSVRVRGNAHQVYEKYLAMARDAQAMGDRIMEENYHQHADHYFRIINNESQEDRNEQQVRRNGNGNNSTTVRNKDVRQSKVESEKPTQDESAQSPQVETGIVKEKKTLDDDTGQATNN